MEKLLDHQPLVSEMVKAAWEAADMNTDLVNQIIVDGAIRAEWELYNIVNCSKRIGDADWR